MFNIDAALKQYKNQLKQDGLAPITITPKRPIYFKIKEYKRTKELALAAEIIEDLESYHILDDNDYNGLLNIASEAQALKDKQKKAAKRTNAKLTPQQLSERNRKAAIARWNKTPKNIIKEIK